MNISTLTEQHPFQQLNLIQQQQLQFPLDLFTKNFSSPSTIQQQQQQQQVANNFLLSQDPSTQSSSSSSSLKQNLNAHQQLLQALNGNTSALLQNQHPLFQANYAIQPSTNSYCQNLDLNEAFNLKSSIQQSQQNNLSNIYNNQRNQQILFSVLMKNQENPLKFAQNPLVNLQQEMNNGEQAMNKRLLQNLLDYQNNNNNNVQIYDSAQIPILMLLQQQLQNLQIQQKQQQQMQQQQQQQQIQQQQQQQQQQIQQQQLHQLQYFLNPHQLLLQHQLQQQQQQSQQHNTSTIIDQKDIRTNHSLSFTNDHIPTELLHLNLKQEANGSSQEKVSCFESPNMSCTALIAPQIQRNSFSNVSQSTPSSLNLGLYSQTSPIIQTKSQQQTAFEGMVYPHQFNLLLQQIQQQQQQQQQFNLFPQIQSNQSYNKIINQQKMELSSLNDDIRNQKSKKKSNPKRNTIKNLGNQIISFMCNKNSMKIIQKIPLIEFEENEFDEFKKFCEQYKNKMLKIADLRNIWISTKPNSDEKTLKYHKIIRVLSRFYLNNEAVPKLLTSNKLKDRKIHLSIRRILVEKLKDPESFTTLNQYSKK